MNIQHCILITIIQGLIHNEDSAMIDLVHDLVGDYISHLKTLILVTIPMSGLLSCTMY